MKAIGRSKGRAGEYNIFSLNCYGGCGHGCTYCYVPRNFHLMRYLGFKCRQDFYNKPFPREGILEALKKEAPRYKGKEVFMSFTTDPYQPINEEHQLTRQAIEILHENEVIVNILTKGKITDFDLLGKRPELSKVGVTYTGADATMEPILKTNYDGLDMIDNLREARKHNISNWVSIEPVINTDNVLNHFIPVYRYDVDLFKLGKWNYDKRANDIDWHRFTNEAVELFEKLGCKYQIKEDLKKYLK